MTPLPAGAVRRFAPPQLSTGWPLLLLLGMFLASGLLGHDPWKSEDAIHFGVVWRAALDGEWVHFHLASGATPEPPLYYWLARLLGTLAGETPLPGAIRTTSLIFTASAAYFLFLSARTLYGRETAAAAPLALAGCLGFMVQSHETQPILASVAALSAVLASLAAINAGKRHATTMLSVSIAAVFLADGLALLPALLILTTITLLASDRGHAASLGGLLLAWAGAALLCLPWLLLLRDTAGGHLENFIAGELARFQDTASPAFNAASYLKQLLWFAWPAWPLAAWGIWARWHARRTTAVWLGASCVLLLLLTLAWTSEARTQSMLLLLPPLALLATQGVSALRRSAGNAFDWFSRLTFSLIAALLWLGWFAMYFGVPPKISHNILRLSPGFDQPVDVIGALFAAALTALWFWFIVREPRSQLRSLGHWSAGIALTWLLVVSLWLPWIEYLKSYRPVGQSLIEILEPTGASCVETQGLGEAQRAALEFALGRRFNDGNDDGCRFLLTQGGKLEIQPADPWRKVWEGHRPGDRNERLRLYHRG